MEKKPHPYKRGLQANRSIPSRGEVWVVSQLRRSAVSVLSNISEGEARKSHKEKRRFYEISCASLVEVDTQIEISLELGLIPAKEVQLLSNLLNECFAMLSKLRTTR